MVTCEVLLVDLTSKLPFKPILVWSLPSKLVKQYMYKQQTKQTLASINKWKSATFGHISPFFTTFCHRLICTPIKQSSSCRGKKVETGDKSNYSRSTNHYFRIKFREFPPPHTPLTMPNLSIFSENHNDQIIVFWTSLYGCYCFRRSSKSMLLKCSNTFH